MKWRTTITLVVLLGVLFAGAYYGWQTIVNPDKPTDSAKSQVNGGCKKHVTVKKGSQVKADDVLVNVYNAGSRGGLAAETLDELVRRGFRRGVADNAPADLLAGPNVTVVLPGGVSEPQTRLVGNQFIGIVKSMRGPALAPGVDVLVGDGFRGINHGARTFVRVNRVVKSCVAERRPG